MKYDLSLGGERVVTTGWLADAKIARGIRNIVIETLDYSGKRRRYKATGLPYLLIPV